MKTTHFFSTSAITILLLVLCVYCKQIRNKEEINDYTYVPVDFTDVKIDGGFWLPRIETNRDVTVWYEFQKCEETGRIDNFAIVGGLKEGGFTGIRFNDSDVFKVIEGASYTMMMEDEPNEKLDKYLDNLIAKIGAAQEDDGYLYTIRTINDPNYKYEGQGASWTDLSQGHELYNVGHMYEAAVAHYQATGKRSLLYIAIKNAPTCTSAILGFFFQSFSIFFNLPAQSLFIFFIFLSHSLLLNFLSILELKRSTFLTNA